VGAIPASTTAAGDLPLSAEAPAQTANEPVVFGRYVHEILSKVDLSGADLQKVATTLARQHGMTDADRRKAVEMIERVLRLALFDEARGATRLFREVPLSTVAALGRTDGRADLLFEYEGQWHVGEFKTAGAPNDLSQTQKSQLAGYGASLKNLSGKPVKVAVCLVHEARVLEG
jgi:ATP-dependent exoDNAse (exonuclease V) beta subunit